MPRFPQSASLSRNLQFSVPSPHLSHSLEDVGGSTLSLAADSDHVYSGSSEHISVWSKATFRLITQLKGHLGSVLCLEHAPDRKWLFSSSGDSTVRIWCTKTFTPLFILNPYSDTDAGDLFSLSWCSQRQTIYIGCQNTSLQWYTFSDNPQSSGNATPRRAHKFFDSFPQQLHRAPAAHNEQHAEESSDGDCVESATSPPTVHVVLNIPGSNVIDSAHYGYIYCMAVIPSYHPRAFGNHTAPDNQLTLATGSGDECVKLWACGPNARPEVKHNLPGHEGAILSLIVKNETVYAGCQDGHVKVWDLETKTLVRSIIVQEGVDVLSISMAQSELYTASANGYVQRWSSSFDCTAAWGAHEDAIVLSSIVTTDNRRGTSYLITGGNDDRVKFWDLASSTPVNTGYVGDFIAEDSQLRSGAMEYALSKFISFPSVSSDPVHREDCRQAAIWLKKCLVQLGAQSMLLPTGHGLNPLVLATFHGTETKRTKPRILFYGHYDVIAAPDQDWDSDPFQLSGRSGYLYGRGASDNKGPIMAMAFAAAELLFHRSLEVDLVFLIEGEEECGSTGFSETVNRHKDSIGRIDAVLLSNSTWIAEEPPCITYGLRGVVRVSLEISSGQPDRHSGIEGGAHVEPMLDLVKLLATLTDSKNQVQVPKFYEQVRPMTEDERQLYSRLAAITQQPASSLAARWREPALTIHNIEVSGPKNATVIPGSVTAQISIRIVPDQELSVISQALVDYLEQSFKTLDTANTIKVQVVHTADWWLGSLEHPWFQTLEEAIQAEWGAKPLRIREGGSIPSIPFLEKLFGCQALHLPIGQSSDHAHLPNERISLSHLHRGKSVLERFLKASAEKFSS